MSKPSPDLRQHYRYEPIRRSAIAATSVAVDRAVERLKPGPVVVTPPMSDIV